MSRAAAAAARCYSVPFQECEMWKRRKIIQDSRYYREMRRRKAEEEFAEFQWKFKARIVRVFCVSLREVEFYGQGDTLWVERRRQRRRLKKRIGSRNRSSFRFYRFEWLYSTTNYIHVHYVIGQGGQDGNVNKGASAVRPRSSKNRWIHRNPTYHGSTTASNSKSRYPIRAL